MRLLGVLVLALAAGCSSVPTPKTSLTLLAVNTSIGRAVFHLDCAPVGGDVSHAAHACAAIAANPALVTRPKAFVCAGGTFSWWDGTISGRFDGRALRRSFSTCWTPQMATLGKLGLSWDALRKHLEPRRHEAVLAGEQRTFPAGRLRPADLVTCDILGHHLRVGVPVETGLGASEGYGGANVVSVTLKVTRNRDGSVPADCR